MIPSVRRRECRLSDTSVLLLVWKAGGYRRHLLAAHARLHPSVRWGKSSFRSRSVLHIKPGAAIQGLLSQTAGSE